MKSKKLIDFSEELDINIPLVASELDTDPNRLRYFSNQDKDLDFHEIELINKAFDKVLNEGDLVFSLNDNAELYEYSAEETCSIILYTFLDLRLIIVDKEDASNIRRIFKEVDE